MDLNQLLSLFRASWDLPWRVCASMLALTTIVGVITGGSALDYISQMLQWAGAPLGVVEAIDHAQTWISVRGGPIGLSGLGLFALALLWAGGRRSERAPATALMGASVAVQAGWGWSVSVILICAFLFWLVALAARIIGVSRAQGHYYPTNLFSIEERLRRTWTAPMMACFYVPLAPISWMIR